MIDALPPEMTKAPNYDQITTGPGYAQATLFGLIGFMLMTMPLSAGVLPQLPEMRNPASWS
jgi:hypothetical protein